MYGAAVATAVSTRGMFGDTDEGPDQIIFPDWETKTFAGGPFDLIDPQDGKVPNLVLLNGPFGRLPPTMPNSVVLPCNASVAVVHVLGGISGWGYPFSKEPTVTAKVRLNYSDGDVEDHPLINGAHFADYIRRVDVPKSDSHSTSMDGKFGICKLFPSVSKRCGRSSWSRVTTRPRLSSSPSRSNPRSTGTSHQPLAIFDKSHFIFTVNVLPLFGFAKSGYQFIKHARVLGRELEPCDEVERLRRCKVAAVV